ncbi:putative ras GTPase-activating protein sar1 [Anaeromyces robustus]|uniref:Putative ras GTPase-activating protein sar1 n=1 Tax=Anaeromyces robustus TaxID=1754192 RepID=A0A1Y1XLN8_9FUNG|nr:putative ras GTPase-activating protein sar1 [Anaeromyces robustus]|eukprot:ORX86652.1 putative ras GTPase-activating protein sar1 [Anaeromyces robustus]
MLESRRDPNQLKSNRYQSISNYQPSNIAKVAYQAAASGRIPLGTSKKLKDKRYSVVSLWSMVAENDVEVDDELTKAQRKLRDLKARISAQSKRNFTLERDVRYLDSRIALLIQNRMALDEQQEVASHLDEIDNTVGTIPDDRKRQLYGNLFYILQSEPKYIASLTRLVSLSEIDTLLQTVMFTIYGNQYESREEHLLLMMFRDVLAAQFESSTDFGSLLRANTPVSRMMTTYTRRGPGQTYLKNVLSERINNLIDHKDLDLEINPLKVYEQMIKDIEEETGKPCDLPKGITQEAAQENTDVQAIIAPRLRMLMEITSSFLKIIIESINQVPYGIRWICKQIRSLTMRKYPTASDMNICSLIGGFFFLRFINPAIVTPQAYMLVDSNPSPNPRRTLTLVAKLLQNLANKPTYSKEGYMISLNPFVEQNKTTINEFLNNLCEVGDFYDSLEMDQYVALSKKELSLNITLNEIYNTHALLLQHADSICPSEDDHLNIILKELGTPPNQVQRKENKSIILPLFSRWETLIADNPSMLADSQLTQGDILYMDTKALMVQIVRTMPALAKEKPLNLMRIAEAAATSHDPTLVRKGIKVRDMLYQLEEIGVSDSKHEFMANEVAQEIIYLGSLKEKVMREIKSLEIVFKTICDHNNYLRSQLESYKAYLQNVRTQSGTQMVKGKEKKNKSNHIFGPIKYTHSQLEKEGIIVESNVPENRRSNIFFNISSPIPGSFIIELHYKGREKPILEMDLKLDDLLEKQQMGIQLLDLEYVRLNVNRVIYLLNKQFLKR